MWPIFMIEFYYVGFFLLEDLPCHHNPNWKKQNNPVNKENKNNQSSIYSSNFQTTCRVPGMLESILVSGHRQGNATDG